MMTPFEDLIHALGTTLGLPLHLDPHGACCLQINEKLLVQIDMDKKQENVLVAAFIGEINPGRFREETLKEALKANAQFTSTGGIGGALLGFCARRNQLACYASLPSSEITVDTLLSALTHVTEYAFTWQEAILNGQTAPPGMKSRSNLPSPFSIRP